MKFGITNVVLINPYAIQLCIMKHDLDRVNYTVVEPKPLLFVTGLSRNSKRLMQVQVEATAGVTEISDTQSAPGMDPDTTMNNSGQTISKRLVQRPVAAGTNIESLQSGIMSSTSETDRARLMQVAAKASEISNLKTEDTPDDA